MNQIDSAYLSPLNSGSPNAFVIYSWTSGRVNDTVCAHNGTGNLQVEEVDKVSTVCANVNRNPTETKVVRFEQNFTEPIFFPLICSFLAQDDNEHDQQH